MHGLMLPSGNDAAHTLAEYFGSILQKKALEIEKQQKRKEAEQIREQDEKRLKEKEGSDKQIGSGLESIQSNLPTSHTQNDNSRGSEDQDPKEKETEEPKELAS